MKICIICGTLNAEYIDINGDPGHYWLCGECKSSVPDFSAMSDEIIDRFLRDIQEDEDD